jgi:hypothetical protein
MRTLAPLDSQAFEEAIAFLTPQTEDMQWATIPWQTDLWTARRLAAQQQKPVFAWMMNGSPLSCV